ncbi:MAG: hypothetical protein O7F11_02350 [Acidobacteria bacterium]|nr:hypothetical protein [Acidobacteriota bacterium]
MGYMRLALPVLVLLATLAAAAPASASLLRPLSIHELTRLSDVVIRGRVVSVRTISSNGGRMPVTLAEIEILEVLNGTLPPRRRLLVTQPGGVANGIELEYAGRPVFTAGEETVLFLQRRAPGRFIPVGLAQGKYNVGPAGTGNDRFLQRDLNGAALIGDAPEHPPATLDELRSRVGTTPRNVSGGRP